MVCTSLAGNLIFMTFLMSWNTAIANENVEVTLFAAASIGGAVRDIAVLIQKKRYLAEFRSP